MSNWSPMTEAEQRARSEASSIARAEIIAKLRDVVEILYGEANRCRQFELKYKSPTQAAGRQSYERAARLVQAVIDGSSR